ncbi:MAG: 50S ribosomal protein L25 [Candidatus Omnitrophota bacterium]|nr:50S ribosomal protein L25 [Candidatus Omnitrophota bacterium]
MEKVILKAAVRSATGKKVAKDLRAKGIIPANVYKAGKGALSLQVSMEAFNEVLHTKAGENVIITLNISGEGSPKDKTVLIKEIQRQPVRDTILHVDFNEISLTETLKVNVPLVSRGEAVGVKIDGGVLEHVIRELQIECLPTAIPEKIEADVSSLKIGDAIHVKDVKIPEGIKVLNDPELIAMIVKPPKVEAPKEEVAEESVEPELIRKKKEDALEAEAAEAPSRESEKPAAGKEAKKE